MLNFWLLTKKNLRLLLRAKWSALIVFLAPLLLILILGLTFNTSSQYGLTIGVHSSEFTADVQQLTASLEAQNFTIKEFPSSVDTCVEEISEGLVHTCLVVPPSLQVSDNIAKEVIFYLDPSNINLVWMVQQTLESEFSLQSQQLAEQLGQDTLSRITSAKDKVTTQNGVLGNVNSQTNSAVSAAGTAKDSLSTINVVVGNATYNVSFIDEAKLGITSGKSKLSDAKDVVEDANLSGTAQSNILSAINSAETQFETVLATLNNDSSITSLLSELESMRTRLSQAASAISESNNNLATTTSALQEVQSSLNGVTSALQEVQSVLEGQQITDAATLTAPLNVRVETVAPQGTYLNYLFPGLLVLVIMFTSLLLGTT
ncbi:hypothetical protein HOC32_06260, partial [Candidatus Woesearchaeota archaeon]|nr:hypothetical protein [Candidatus Woesearchaeota archaeon]